MNTQVWKAASEENDLRDGWGGGRQRQVGEEGVARPRGTSEPAKAAAAKAADAEQAARRAARRAEADAAAGLRSLRPAGGVIAVGQQKFIEQKKG